LQTVSCSFGTIEAKPEATKLLVRNYSNVQLLNVIWNGTNLGDINFGGIYEMDVLQGNSPIYFSIRNGKQYRTRAYILGKKYERNEFNFIDNTLVIDVETNIQSLLGGILNVE